MKDGWAFEPRFLAKCPECGATFEDYRPDACDACDSPDLIEPDPTQLDGPNTFIEDIDPDRINTFEDYLTQSTRDIQICDQSFLQIQRNVGGLPMHMYRTDPLRIEVVYRANGRLGGNTWFCEENPAHTQLIVAQPDASDENPPTCPEDGSTARRVAYIMRVPRDFSGVHAQDQHTQEGLVYFASEDYLYNTNYGAATLGGARPLPATIATIVSAQLSMDRWNRDNYTAQSSPNTLIGIKGVTPDSLQEQQRKITEHTRRNDTQGHGTKSIWMALGPDGGFEQVRALESMVDLDTFRFQEMYRDATFQVYGISAKFAGVEVAGKLGGGAEGYQADRDTIEELKKQVGEAWNRFFRMEWDMPDWRFRFNPEATDTSVKDAEVAKLTAEAVAILNGVGQTAIMDPRTHELVILSDTIEEPERVEPGGMEPGDEGEPEVVELNRRFRSGVSPPVGGLVTKDIELESVRVARTFAAIERQQAKIDAEFEGAFDGVEDDYYRKVFQTGFLRGLDPASPVFVEDGVARYLERGKPVFAELGIEGLLVELYAEAWRVGVLSVIQDDDFDLTKTVATPTDRTDPGDPEANPDTIGVEAPGTGALAFAFNQPDTDLINATQLASIDSFKNTWFLDTQRSTPSNYVSTIRDILQRGAEGGQSVDDMTRTMQEVFDPKRDLKRWMYRRIARTESTRMYANARRAALQERARRFPDDPAARWGRLVNPAADQECVAFGVNGPPDEIRNLEEPPFHPNCGCQVVSLSPNQRKRVRAGDTGFQREKQAFDQARANLAERMRTTTPKERAAIKRDTGVDPAKLRLEEIEAIEQGIP